MIHHVYSNSLKLHLNNSFSANYKSILFISPPKILRLHDDAIVPVDVLYEKPRADTMAFKAILFLFQIGGTVPEQPFRPAGTAACRS
jgi:hypothetical protein